MSLGRTTHLTAILATVFGSGIPVACTLRGAEPVSELPSVVSPLVPGASLILEVPAPAEARLRSVLVSFQAPGRIEPGLTITAHLEPTNTRGNAASTLTKPLHLGDPDVDWIVQQAKGEAVRVTVTSPPVARSRTAGSTLNVAVRVADLGTSPETSTVRKAERVNDDSVAFETEPNDTPESANPLTLGRTVYGLADDRPYLPTGDQPADPEAGPGVNWFRFTHDSDHPQLVFFALDFVNRDVPPDVRIYQKQDGRLVEFTQGIDPQSLQRERPPRLGANKFTTRVIARGTYFVRVDACQPEYQLRTKVFDLPPYLESKEVAKASPETIAAAARKAIRTAMDFQLLAGDSWHANTPRKGNPLDRVANFHHETSTCIACHATHFTTQSVLAAVKSGYDVEQPFALRFLTERLANNPVPFHGHEEALWARMIPAPANVLGRLSTMVMDYEDRIAGDHHDNLHRGVAEFLKLYYDGRTALPPDETNGNNPVSRYKVAADSWRQLDEIAHRTSDPRFAATRDLVARLLPTGKPANTRDLAAQTIGLCQLDARQEKLAGPIASNVGWLLSLQRTQRSLVGQI